jgi:rod shape-determining protein MreC
MLELTSRHRPLSLLGATLLVQVMLLAFQIKREHDVRLIRVWAVELMTPLQRAGTWGISGVRGGWRNYVDLRHTRTENQQLRAELARLQLRNRELESGAAEGQRLAALLNFREAHADVPLLTAEVIGASPDATSHSIYINCGEKDGVRRNMGVITPDGVVGKIVEVYATTAQVLLLTDRESGVGALLAATRTHGVVKGTGDPYARLDYVVNDERLSPGEEILTSGEDRIFPKDLPIGTVISAKNANPFQVIEVRPAARLDRLEEVLVLQTQKELSPTKDATAAPAKPAAAPR